MNDRQIIDWLLEGDVSIQYQVHRDLLGNDRKDIQKKIAEQGWGRQFLERRKANGHWGERFYQPKWISTHYTLLDLRHLNISRDNEIVKETISMVLKTGKSNDGGIKLGPSTLEHSDICVNGMFLNYASYFQSSENDLRSLIDCILAEKMPDGAFNCRSIRSGAIHSSLHTTISVLEGFTEFQKSGNHYREREVSAAIKSAVEFILMHKLFLSDHSGRIIDKKFLNLSFPGRWKYDILRALDYFRYAGQHFDDRMEVALNLLKSKRNKDGLWNMQAAHPGKVHFIMETAGKPSRWNTLRAWRVLKHFEPDRHF